MISWNLSIDTFLSIALSGLQGLWWSKTTDPVGGGYFFEGLATPYTLCVMQVGGRATYVLLTLWFIFVINRAACWIISLKMYLEGTRQEIMFSCWGMWLILKEFGQWPSSYFTKTVSSCALLDKTLLDRSDNNFLIWWKFLDLQKIMSNSKFWKSLNKRNCL